MNDNLSAVFNGSIGHFWWSSADVTDQEVRTAGYIKRLDSGLLEVESLLDLERDVESFMTKRIPNVVSAQAIVRTATIQLSDRANHSGSWHIGGRASVDIFRFRCLVLNAPIDSLKSTNLRELSANFRDLLGWAGMTTLERSVRTDATGRAKGASYALSYALDTAEQLQEVRLTANATLRIEPYWRTSEDKESAFLYTYLKIGISCNNPMPVRELADSLGHVRQLLSTVYQRDIFAEECAAHLDAEDFGRPAKLWHQKLNFTSSKFDSAVRDDRRPYVSLQKLGGAQSIARWIRLSNSFPRLTRPIAGYWQSGPQVATVDVAELAMTIEYCVAVTRSLKKRPKWTQERVPSVALAKKVGKCFAEWTSDAEEWGLLFWDTYNHLKHNHMRRDPHQVATMAAGARVLLTAYLLSRISGSAAPAKQFLNDYRWENLRDTTREYVSNSHLKTTSSNQRRKSRAKK